MNARWIRKERIIQDVLNGEATDHKTINAAKRASRKLQLEADGALGRGSLRRER
jgi:hypothetical protein